MNLQYNESTPNNQLSNQAITFIHSKQQEIDHRLPKRSWVEAQKAGVAALETATASTEGGGG